MAEGVDTDFHLLVCRGLFHCGKLQQAACGGGSRDYDQGYRVMVNTGLCVFSMDL